MKHFKSYKISIHFTDTDTVGFQISHATSPDGIPHVEYLSNYNTVESIDEALKIGKAIITKHVRYLDARN